MAWAGEKNWRSSIPVVSTVPGLHLGSPARASNSCGHATCMIVFFVLALSEFLSAPPCRNRSKYIALAIYFEASPSDASAACAVGRRLADVSTGGVSKTERCRSRFARSADYIPIPGTFRAPAQLGGHGHILLVVGPAFWGDPGFPLLLSKSVITDLTAGRCYHVSCTLSASWRRCIATGLPTSTRTATSCCFTSRFGMAVSQNTLCLFTPPDGRGNK